MSGIDRLQDIPLDTPIPDSRAMYCWSPDSEAWVTWDRWIEETVFQPNRARRERRRPQGLLFEETA
jgi:hypothetical protein